MTKNSDRQMKIIKMIVKVRNESLADGIKECDGDERPWDAKLSVYVQHNAHLAAPEHDQAGH